MKKPTPPKDLWAQMDAITGPPLAYDDPGFTAPEFAKRHKISDTMAYKKLGLLVKDGKVVVGWRRKPEGGKPQKVYRPA